MAFSIVIVIEQVQPYTSLALNISIENAIKLFKFQAESTFDVSFYTNAIFMRKVYFPLST